MYRWRHWDLLRLHSVHNISKSNDRRILWHRNMFLLKCIDEFAVHPFHRAAGREKGAMTCLVGDVPDSIQRHFLVAEARRGGL